MWIEFINALNYCDEAYGSFVITNENTGAFEGFVCPHCDEAIYFEDWDGEPETENWMACPVCGMEWSDD